MFDRQIIMVTNDLNLDLEHYEMKKNDLTYSVRPFDDLSDEYIDKFKKIYGDDVFFFNIGDILLTPFKNSFVSVNDNINYLDPLYLPQAIHYVTTKINVVSRNVYSKESLPIYYAKEINSSVSYIEDYYHVDNINVDHINQSINILLNESLKYLTPTLFPKRIFERLIRKKYYEYVGIDYSNTNDDITYEEAIAEVNKEIETYFYNFINELIKYLVVVDTIEDKKVYIEKLKEDYKNEVVDVLKSFYSFIINDTLRYFLEDSTFKKLHYINNFPILVKHYVVPHLFSYVFKLLHNLLDNNGIIRIFTSFAFVKFKSMPAYIYEKKYGSDIYTDSIIRHPVKQIFKGYLHDDHNGSFFPKIICYNNFFVHDDFYIKKIELYTDIFQYFKFVKVIPYIESVTKENVMNYNYPDNVAIDSHIINRINKYDNYDVFFLIDNLSTSEILKNRVNVSTEVQFKSKMFLIEDDKIANSPDRFVDLVSDVIKIKKEKHNVFNFSILSPIHFFHKVQVKDDNSIINNIIEESLDKYYELYYKKNFKYVKTFNTTCETLFKTINLQGLSYNTFFELSKQTHLRENSNTDKIPVCLINNYFVNLKSETCYKEESVDSFEKYLQICSEVNDRSVSIVYIMLDNLTRKEFESYLNDNSSSIRGKIVLNTNSLDLISNRSSNDKFLFIKKVYEYIEYLKEKFSLTNVNFSYLINTDQVEQLNNFHYMSYIFNRYTKNIELYPYIEIKDTKDFIKYYLQNYKYKPVSSYYIVYTDDVSEKESYFEKSFIKYLIRNHKPSHKTLKLYSYF